MSSEYIRVFTVFYLVVLALALGHRDLRRWSPHLKAGALGILAFPFATFVARLVPGLTTAFTLAQALFAVALAALVGWLASRLKRHELQGFAWISALTIAIIVVDCWSGTRMHVSGWLGYSVHNAGRFYGLPNTTFAVLGACTLLLSVIMVKQAERRSEALWKVACLYLVVLVSAGLPMLGADVGSVITLVPIFGGALLALSGRRVRISTLVLAGLAMVVLVGVVAGIDLSRPADQRSHLGQFTERLLEDGPSELVDTFARKQSANFRLLQGSQWSRMVPVAAAFLFGLLVWQRRYDRLLPPGGPLRIGFWSVLAATALGFASNDSGPIVIALFLAHLPPFILMRALLAEDPPPVLVVPPAAVGPT